MPLYIEEEIDVKVICNGLQDQTTTMRGKIVRTSMLMDLISECCLQDYFRNSGVKFEVMIKKCCPQRRSKVVVVSQSWSQ